MQKNEKLSFEIIEINRILPAKWNKSEVTSKHDYIIVRELEPGLYEIINGNQNLIELRKTNKKKIRCLNMMEIADSEAYEIALRCHISGENRRTHADDGFINICSYLKTHGITGIPSDMIDKFDEMIHYIKEEHELTDKNAFMIFDQILAWYHEEIASKRCENGKKKDNNN